MFSKNRKSVFWTIISIIIIAIILYFLITSFLGSKEKTISLTQLAQKVVAAASDKNHSTYFTQMRVDSFSNTISATFNQKVVDGSIIQSNFVIYGSYNLFESILKDINSNIKLSDAFFGDTSQGIVGVQAPKPNVALNLFISLIPTLLLIGIIYFVYRAQAKMMSGQGGAFGEKNPAQIIKSDKKFSDIAGNKEPIEEISEIVDYLKNPKKYQDSGARMPHGILLGGPPGTGKTLLAKATAGEANVPFFFVSASNFVELFVGMGAKRVRQVIAEARKNAPAIIFIDELDAIGRTRGSGIGGGHDEREQTLNQLLVEMDGIKENSGLLFVAATNRTDVLDPALTRPGRFDRVITVGLPDIKEREEILKLHAKGKRFASNVLFSNIARRTPGFSGAQLENVVNEAVLLSIREKSDLITLEIIDEAIDRVMAGPAKKSRTITKEELTAVAYHEAGHAVVGIRIPGGNKVQKITIIPRGQAGGYNLMMPENEKYNYTKEELLASIASFMGGRAAEEFIYGKNNISTGASDDIDKATNIARRMVTEFGMSDLGPIKYHEEKGSPFLGKTLATNSSLSNQVSHEIDLEIRKIILEAQRRAYQTISENTKLLELIKTLLLQKETIIAEEISYIAEHLELPPEHNNSSESDSSDQSVDDLIFSTEQEKEQD
ncbi:ATP-dependent zinc metalloprotease FtsH [Mycoplasma sp. 246B]